MDVPAVDELELNVKNILNEETTDERLESLITQIEAAGKPSSKQIEFHDHDSIRDSLMMGINESKNGLTVLLGYDGNGRADERELVNLLTARVAHRLDRGELTSGQQLTTQLSLEEQASADQLKAAQNQSIDEATWIVDQIENDLSNVKQTLSLAGDTASRFRNDTKTEGASPFQYASSSSIVSAPAEATSSIEAIDVQPLRTILTDIRNRSDYQASLLLKQERANNELLVDELKTSQTIPINGTPSIASTILLGLLALVVASVVAIKFEPFAERGFESSNRIENRLGIHNVAEIRESDTENHESEKVSVPWSNRTAQIAGLALFGIFVVVAGFVLVDSEVRETFFDNPLYGCAKIVRIFAGY